MHSIEILSTGVGLSIQDRGRPGWRRFGVPPGGAMDRASARAANQLLGNRPDAAVLEILMQGAKLRIVRDTWVALAGADLACELPVWTARQLKAGTLLSFPHNRAGLWTYLAVPGGFAVDTWFGSASVDARNGLGRPLQPGCQLSARLCEPNSSLDRVARRRLAADQQRDFCASMNFELLPGPQFESFTEHARAQFFSAEWTVSARSDRTGFRLEGPRLEVPASIRSEPVLPGSFQIPGNGLPIVTMADGPTVGGYAKIAVLKQADIDWLAQCRPGTRIRFSLA
jgi:biotin-dependent carboxylase-like uncharacterized protein